MRIYLSFLVLPVLAFRKPSNEQYLVYRVLIALERLSDCLSDYLAYSRGQNSSICEFQEDFLFRMTR